jgi:hypothetical protein
MPVKAPRYQGLAPTSDFQGWGVVVRSEQSAPPDLTPHVFPAQNPTYQQSLLIIFGLLAFRHVDAD